MQENAAVVRFTGGLPETRCGAGSTLRVAGALTVALPRLIRELTVNASPIRSLIDAPCGDFNWMSVVDLGAVNYVGIDIDQKHLTMARQRSRPNDRFEQRDILAGPLPYADVVLCRDFLQHLPNKMALLALDNLSSGAWLLATSHSNAGNEDITDVGGFRPLNLTAGPFNLPQPFKSVADPPGSGRIIGAWATADLVR